MEHVYTGMQEQRSVSNIIEPTVNGLLTDYALHQ